MRRKTLFYLDYVLCATFFLAFPAIVIKDSAEQAVAEAAEKEHQQQEEEQKAVISASEATTVKSHIEIPP